MMQLLFFARRPWRYAFFSGLFGCLLFFAFGAHAIPQPSNMSTPKTGAAGLPPAGLATGSAPLASEKTNTLSLQELGAGNPIRLSGTTSGESIWFGTRTDEIVTRARLKLSFAYSPSLTANLSHIKVYVNEEVVDSIILPKEQTGGQQTREIDIDTRFLGNANKLRFQLVGHYTSECEDMMHTSIWASISNQSRLELTLQKLNMPNDLALLPAPFYDEHDNRRLTLPFVFATAPSTDTLRAAGVLASWFSANAGYRGAHFPVLSNQLPERYGVVFASNDNTPATIAGLTLTPVDSPTLKLIAHPNDPTAKLLLVLGRNDSDLKLAADALALGQAVLSGPTATVNSIDYPKRRLAYDAPNWLPVYRPVKFGELVKQPSELQIKGRDTGPIRINVRIPADLMIWQNEGVPVDIKYRYTPPVANDNSALNFSINENFIKSLLIHPSRELADHDNMLIPVRDDESQLNKNFTIPAFDVGSNNQLQLQFIFGDHKQGWCISGSVDSVMAAIDADSVLDFSNFLHYAALPNLAFFANSGFPFTKFADLAETTIILPATPNSDDIEAMLGLLGQMGQSTGFPALAYQLVLGDQTSGREDSDLLLIDTAARHPLLKSWNKNFPALTDKEHNLFAGNSQRAHYPYRLFDPGLPVTTPASSGKTSVSSSGALGMLTGFESPLHRGRSVVALIGNGSEGARHAVDALEDPGSIRYIRGDVAIMRGKTVESFQVGANYFTGNIPFWIWTWFHISRHPFLLASMGIGSGLFIAFVCYWALRRIAQKRLQG
ncbi:cellulose biosynthesis cyclic di-GMP-binding regulatory protein BcsB [Candidatus Methylospira mobilis]|uniref:Cyclic di-GMP-binding protein n=1 Tax=Candidatus Methylospira mobilis TaxID=1808979 RepID=A0A5Q0BJ25_9GAMM|nr:cellulose biosynthesis cyclic di-GMP-binding regulatory protein BcsB [Candidatus Methylospira mobilis]QFY42174.1 cellulose biosynthesis cyclic di-GMP-binding regulatory protein BcsB [Candidatus Methylospira mobilis]WNV03189.1 cellulose biosynthesis cyclic di-GMP-binding regulatory protein BcsB [Candidatus Methylospira mobilis]